VLLGEFHGRLLHSNLDIMPASCRRRASGTKAGPHAGISPTRD
jgi:hypothetical protein